jgi:hypothetical protein
MVRAALSPAAALAAVCAPVVRAIAPHASSTAAAIASCRHLIRTTFIYPMLRTPCVSRQFASISRQKEDLPT